MSTNSTAAVGLPLAGRTALITGGGRGIGAATTRALAARGADVVITYHSDTEAATELAGWCRSVAGATAHTTPFDLTASDGPAELLTAVGALRSEIDILIVNAAAPYPKEPLGRLSGTELTAKVSQDLASLHQLVTGLVPAMSRRGFGRVVVLGSLHADGPSAPGMTANGVSKAALAAYVEFAVEELTGPGVTINVVHPGYITTEASSHLPSTIPALLDELTPAGRGGRPEDVAAIVALLCSAEAEFVNGARVPVSGGLNHPVSLRRVLAAPR